MNVRYYIPPDIGWDYELVAFRHSCVFLVNLAYLACRAASAASATIISARAVDRRWAEAFLSRLCILVKHAEGARGIDSRNERGTDEGCVGGKRKETAYYH